MKRRVQVRFWYGLFLAVFTAALAISLIAAAAQIYYADPDGEPFSRALVGERLLPFLAPSVLYALAVVGGGVLACVFPVKQGEKVGAETVLARLYRKIPQGAGEEYERARRSLIAYERARLVLWGLGAAAAVAAFAVAAVYLADVSHFPAASADGKSQVTAEILRFVRFVLPASCVTCALFLAAALYETFTLKPRIASAKAMIAHGNGAAAGAGKAERAFGVVCTEQTVWLIRGALFVVCVLFLVAGVMNGGAKDVLLKAIKICTECVGLG